MKELQENMYVRTKSNGICKLYREFSEDSVDVGIAIFPEINGFFIDKEKINYIEKEDIIKASFNVIDLIEVGDYVNGYLVIEKPYKYHDMQFVSLDTRDSWGYGCGEMPIENIKSIVTKEQFEQINYKMR